MFGWLAELVTLVAAHALAFGSTPRGEKAFQRAPVLVVKAIESSTQAPLPNAEVIDLESGVRRFTNLDGEARLSWPDRGTIRLRVRQLGFQFVDRELVRTAGPAEGVDTVTFALSRIAYVLPDVATRGSSACATDADPAAKLLSAAALGQLRMGAERYDTFRKTYPFRIRQKRRTIRFHQSGVASAIRENTEESNSNDYGELYKPGRVIDRSSAGFSVPLLFLTALADSVFWEHHCFSVQGVETFGADRVLRLTFMPAANITSVDWMGTALLDSATSLLRRVEFQLANLRDTDIPRRLEGYTTFRSPSPFIVIPDSTVAMWWRRELDTSPGAWDGPDVLQLLQLLNVTYRKAKPPQQK